MGLKETKELLLLGAKLGNALGEYAQDGVAAIFDDLLGIYGALGPALEGIDLVDDELLAASEEDYAELEAFVADNFDIPQDQTEQFAKDALKLGIAFVRVYKHF
jgi:hypothetical protein